MQRVLFVVPRFTGAPVQYRARIPAEVLNSKPELYACRLVWAWSTDLPAALRWADVVILTLIPTDQYLSRIILQFRSEQPSTPVLASMDDPNFRSIGPDGARLPLADDADRYLWGLKVSDGFVATTKSLASMGSTDATIPSFVAPNCLSDRLIQRGARVSRTPRLPGGFRMLFMSGSGTHDRHWTAAAPAVREYLELHPDVRLWLCGPLSIGNDFDGLKGQVRRFPYLDPIDLPHLIRQADVVLVPNAEPEPLADAKSTVKWTESAAVGTPVIATPTEPYRDATRDERGWTAATHTEWLGALEAAASTGHARGRAAQKALGSLAGPETLEETWGKALARRAAPKDLRSLAALEAMLPSHAPVPEPRPTMHPGERVKARPNLRAIIGALRNPSL